ncbi:DUF916 and DUF3324 domain-containing protein [Dellaglioa sp. L3N]
MKKRVTAGIFAAFATVLFFAGSQVAKVQAAAMSFSVEAQIPSNQIDKNQTYFDLKMKPNQKQTLVVDMKNATNKAVTVEVHPNAAMTNDNGVVEYKAVNPTLDKSMTQPFSKLATTDTTVTIPAKSAIKQKIDVTMPAKPYTGLIAGGIYFTEKIDKAKEKADKSGVQIKNRYAYVVGVSLRENTTSVKPNMELLSIKPGQANYRNTLKVKLQDNKMTAIKNLKVHGKVYARNGKKVLFESKTSNMTMAPNTNFNYGISWDNQEFKAGKYRLEMTADSGKNHWEWKQNFTINGADAKKLNKKAVDLEKDYTMWYILAGFLILLLLFLILFLILRRKNKKDKEEAVEEAKRQLLEELDKK